MAVIFHIASGAQETSVMRKEAHRHVATQGAAAAEMTSHGSFAYTKRRDLSLNRNPGTGDEGGDDHQGSEQGDEGSNDHGADQDDHEGGEHQGDKQEGDHGGKDDHGGDQG